jgi:hypothetical protein
MNIIPIVDAVLDDLVLVASSLPNERLPKEEQVRCCVYAAIRPLFRVVCAERGYGSIDDQSRAECDLWASSPDCTPVWLELKRCWSASGLNNKPPEQFRHWEADLDKLRRVPLESERYFLLVGFFDFDPLHQTDFAHSGVIQNIHRFHTNRQVHRISREFSWRATDGISWIGVWVWCWEPGFVVED